MESWKRNYGDNIEMLAFLTRHHRFTDATIAGQPTRVVRTSVRGRHNKERALRTFGKKSVAGVDACLVPLLIRHWLTRV
jgi:hypothetical protein